MPDRHALRNFAIGPIGWLWLLVAVGAMLTHCAGCTSQAARYAILGMQRSADHQQQAFDNAYRMAQEQMFLSTVQQLRLQPETAEAALQAYAMARTELEEARVQYMLGRAMGLSTYIPYLYDQQGPLNVLFEDGSRDFSIFSGALQAANAAAGVDSPLDLLPDPEVPASAEDPEGSSTFEQLLREDHP